MTLKEGRPGFYTQSIFQVLRNQEKHLLPLIGDLIKKLNKLYGRLDELLKEQEPQALLFVNHGQESFEIGFAILDKQGEPVFFYNEFDGNFADEEEFGVNEYEFEVDEHPTEDMFYVLRSKAADQQFFIWFMEAIWNSDFMKTELPLIYSHTQDLDELVDLKNGVMEYHDFSFLDA